MQEFDITAGDGGRRHESFFFLKLLSGEDRSAVEGWFELGHGGIDELSRHGDFLARQGAAGGVDAAADVGQKNDAQWLIG